MYFIKLRLHHTFKVIVIFIALILDQYPVLVASNFEFRNWHREGKNNIGTPLAHTPNNQGIISITIFACEAGLQSMPTLHQQMHRLHYDLDTNCLQKSECSEKDTHSKAVRWNTPRSHSFVWVHSLGDSKCWIENNT